MNFGVCDFSRLAVTDWRLRRWRLWFLALSNAPRLNALKFYRVAKSAGAEHNFPKYLISREGKLQEKEKWK